MNQGWNRVTQSIRDTCLEGLFYLPVAVAVAKLIERGYELLLFVAIVFVIRVIGVVVTRYVQRRVWLFGFGVIASGLGALLVPATLSQQFVLFLLIGASFWRSIRIVSASEYLYPLALYVVGLVSYAGYAALSFHYPTYRPLLGLMTTLAIVCILLFLVFLNRTTLLDASFTETDKVEIDRKVKETNRMHLAALFGVIVFLSLFWPVLGVIAHAFTAWTAGHGSHTQVSAPHTSGTQALHMKPSRTGHASRILSIVLQIFGIALLVVVGAWFAIQAGRLIIALALRLFYALKGKVNTENHGYIDHVDHLKGPSIKERLALTRLRRAKRSLRWDDLKDPRDKIRYVYLKLVQDAIARGLPWSRSKDSSEVIHQVREYFADSSAVEQLRPFATLYHRARYSDHLVTEAESEETLQILKSARLIDRKQGQ
ncbi:DUF4129 domain-containing protein [Alicyclobacillus ferrooxydans]|uniref:DUF4129 domain-containing protein n=1 Tax=Alicyclobacillus ferrooxydans TaxID=471514 RepID=A0A0P9D8A6_9BACL|nr:DUF4129 domain-containing protein [Alicyclobacillus ferrooxydans]KPV45534.1 hypothetical protein AN477_00865 [Alicyclobacillus ferrooxydans]